jgi:phosphoenolpyruvate synthase/pyruvate phosphate dikinase
MMGESEEEGEICLTPGQIQELYTLIRKIEKTLHEPVTVDWAFDHGRLYILRARPFTDKTLKRYQ